MLKDITLGQYFPGESYIHNMDEVMNAADLVVSRSGAITVSELSALGKPAVLIPSPNVVRNHQEQNARAFCKKFTFLAICPNILLFGRDF